MTGEVKHTLGIQWRPSPVLWVTKKLKKATSRIRTEGCLGASQPKGREFPSTCEMRHHRVLEIERSSFWIEGRHSERSDKKRSKLINEKRSY